MRSIMCRLFVAGAMTVGSVGMIIGGASQSAAAHSDVTFTTVLTGLNNPRGLAFDGKGNMYVSESGSAGDGPFGLNQTGKVSKYDRRSMSPLWSTAFESLYISQDPSQPPDVLGPEGISALGGKCATPNDRNTTHQDKRGKHEHGCEIRMIMSESHDGILRDSGGAVDTTQIGHLFSINGATGVATSVSDVGDQMFKFTVDNADLFPSDFPDSNPYGVLITKGKRDDHARTFVADAGANTVLEIMADGTARTIAYIPNESTVPFRDATPTCIAQGPDGMLYVATLNFVANLFVAGSGQSNVWRGDPNADFPTQPTLWASGLTTPTSCTFDDEGNFWAAEMFQPNAAGAPGDVVRIPFKHPDRLERMGGGMLPIAGAIAQGPGHAMYVAINSSSSDPNAGAVVKIVSADDQS